jgi:hypothetical protein
MRLITFEVEKMKRDICLYISNNNHSNLTPSHKQESTLRLRAFVGMYNINPITSEDKCYVLHERWCRIDAIIHNHSHYYRSSIFSVLFIITNMYPDIKLKQPTRIVITMNGYFVIYLFTKPAKTS